MYRGEKVDDTVDHLLKEIELRNKLIFALARHIRNPDLLEYIAWGRRGSDLLCEVKGLDPERYFKEVLDAEESEDKEPYPDYGF